MLDVLKLFLLALAVYWISALIVQRKLIFPSSMVVVRTDSSSALEQGVESHWLETEQGRTEYWLKLAPGADAENSAGIVVFAHGNAELIDDQEWAIEVMNDLGYSIAICEFRGYGRSDGSPSEEHIVADHRAMLRALMQRPEVDLDRLVYFGRSLGGGVVCALAAEIPPRAIVLQSTFSSLKRMARSFLLPPFLVRDPFDNQAVLEDFEGPVLLLHGREDRVIPFDHAERLHAATPRSTLLVFESDHNDLPLLDPRVTEGLRASLEPANW